ncbi:hypothetical protein GCM10023085_27790 [Actinomadura viridis]|uniref:Uncharacterized protein n=1 Tax=Actinomadura viridis TaxID=58110 RepID=A0A931DBQ7_9ACTN|nr:hypothetical protein [Actinomadura viridis]MBG6087235.1 hypothetical protein [Actinomadura viridis]
MSPLERRVKAGRIPGERGEGAINYLVVILLIVLVAAAMVTSSMGGLVVGGIKYAICKVAKVEGVIDCEMPQDRDYRTTCLTNLGVSSHGGNVEALIFRVGRDYTFLRITTVAPDGTKTVTILAIKGVTGGVGTGVGAGLNLGRFFNAGVDAVAEAKGRVGIGEGWEFTGPDAEQQADRFQDQIQEQYGIDAVKENGGPLGYIGGNIYDYFAGPDIPDPQIRRFEGEFDLYAGVWGMLSAGMKDPQGRHRKPDRFTDPEGTEPNPRDSRGSDWLSPNTSAWAAVNGNEKAVLSFNERTGETSVQLMIRGEFNYGANYGVNGPQGRVNATGIMSLTRDKNGVLTSVSFTQRHVVNGQATGITTDLPLRTDEERMTVLNYLLHPASGGPGGQTLALTFNDMAPTTDPGPDASPLQRLLYENGKTSKVTSDYDQVNSLWGAGVKLGIKLGLSYATTELSMSANEGHYLGAPRPDGTRPYLPQPECRD